MRVAFLMSKVATARIGARSARPIDVLELLKIRSAIDDHGDDDAKHPPQTCD